jgi:phosphoribosylamine--glycine ligase
VKVLVVGSGGREHALCWKIAQSKYVQALYCAPGNPGITDVAELVPLAVDDIGALVDFCIRTHVDFVVVGPELPLSLGLVDALEAQNIAVFGPRQAAAQLESSKSFCKEVMRVAGVPTANAKIVTNLKMAFEGVAKFGGPPVVLKADGLASGKGVYVCFTDDQVKDAIEALYAEDSSRVVLIEEFLEGVEVSYIVCASGEFYVPLTSSHDYKRIGEGNTGLNTGGMGSVSPSPYLSVIQEQVVQESVVEPVLREMCRRGTPFTGFLYAGLMVCPNGEVKVLEFNARLGDPETQVLLSRLQSDLLGVLYGLAKGDLDGTRSGVPASYQMEWAEKTAVCVVHASAGYPETSAKGDVITGLEQAALVPESVVFHAGTVRNESGQICTNGGRVLGVVGLGKTLEEACLRSYQASDIIQFRGKQMRRDIGGSNSAQSE